MNTYYSAKQKLCMPYKIMTCPFSHVLIYLVLSGRTPNIFVICDTIFSLKTMSAITQLFPTTNQVKLKYKQIQGKK